jgi:putative transcriptional regulator
MPITVKPLPLDILLLVCRVILYAVLVVFGLVLLLVAGISLYGAFANPDLARTHGRHERAVAPDGGGGVSFRAVVSVGSSTAWPKADPFNLVNSGRLQQLAWLTLAFQMLALAAHARGGDFRILHINGVEGLFSTGGGISFGRFPAGARAVHPRPRVPQGRRDARRAGRNRVMPITVKLDDLLHARRMTMTELAERIDLTLANVSILKTGKARAIRFSTLEAICRELECQPGDLLGYETG